MNIKYQDDIDKLLLNRMSTIERLWFNIIYGWRSEVKEQLSFTKEAMRAIQSRQQKVDLIRECKKMETEEITDFAAAAECTSIQRIQNEIDSLEAEMRHGEMDYLEQKESLTNQSRDLQEQIENISYKYKQPRAQILKRIQELKDELNRIGGK